MDDSAITCDETINAEGKLYDEKTNFNVKEIASKTQNFYILLAFLLINVALLIAASLYCYLISSKTKTLATISCHK